MQPWSTVYFSDSGHRCYDQLKPVKIRYPLARVTWPYRWLKLVAHWGHVIFWSWPLTKCWFSIGSRAQVWLTFWKQGRIVLKTVNSNLGLKVKTDLLLFLLYADVFLLLCFVYTVIIETQNRRQNNIQKTSPPGYKTQIKILPFAGSAQSALRTFPSIALRIPTAHNFTRHWRAPIRKWRLFLCGWT